MPTELIEYSHGDTTLEGFFAAPEGSAEPLPSILIAHAWGGRNEFVENIARQLATEGYAAMAMDNYGKGVLGTGPEDNMALMRPFLEDRSLLRDRLLAGLDTLAGHARVDAGRIAAIGYCFGGLCALDLARCGAAIRAAISFHGLLKAPDFPTRSSGVKVLALHGWDDPMVPPEQVLAFREEMNALELDWQLHGYGGTYHSFTMPGAEDMSLGVRYSERAQRRSWHAMHELLAEVM